MQTENDGSRLNWDDARYVLAVARAGSLTGAAKALEVKHSTMLRRIDAIEARLQVRLFERLRSGYVLTEAGETVCQAAEQCEPLIAEAERRIVGGDTRLLGLLRITTAHVSSQFLLPPVLAAFRSAHPGIEVEVHTAKERIDLSRREADVAVRISSEVPDYLVGRRLGDLRFRIYGWHDAPYMAALERGVLHPIERLASSLPWICFERDATDRSYDRWLHAHVPATSTVIRVDHFPASQAMVRTGIGVALLPEFVAATVPGTVPLSAPIEELATPLWLLTHPDLRRTARVVAFMQVVGDALAMRLQVLAAL